MMKKQALWFLLIGNLCMSFPVFTRSFLTVPESIEDFFKGMGIVFVFYWFLMVIRNKGINCSSLKAQEENIN
jgi:hypothetical protein